MENIQVIFSLLGGLAMFLFGMNHMSDALQKSAGDKMKKILQFLTRNPLMGALAGALVTAILQSSSATTVMVIGFVSAGLMTLPQAISVIFGANIGTTMTAQLIAFKLSDYVMIIIFTGFVINFIAKSEKMKNIGLLIFSFGLLFEGIEVMSTAMKPLASSPIFIDLMGRVKEYPPLGVLLGLVMTLVVQSSSATIAVLQSFASQAGPDGITSVIGLAGAIPILMGDNIGTTITALLASIGQSRDSKRTALAHSLFNISGAIGLSMIIPIFSRFIVFISPKGNEVDVISRQIANAHSVFNILCACIWIPLIPLMVKIVCLLVKDKPSDHRLAADDIVPLFLDDSMLNQPVAAIYLISQEISHASGLVQNLLKSAQIKALGNYSQKSINTAISQSIQSDQRNVKELKRRIASTQDTGSEDADDIIVGTITPDEALESYDILYRRTSKLIKYIEAYISKLFSSGSLTQLQSEEAASLLNITSSLERITDRCAEIMRSFDEIAASGHVLSDDAAKDLKTCFKISRKLYERAICVVQSGNAADAEKIEHDKNKMRKAQKQFNKSHLKRVNEKKCDANVTPMFSAILYAFDRLVDNCAGISEEALDPDSHSFVNDLLQIPQAH